MMEAPLDQLSLKTSQEGGSAQPSSAEYNDEPADELIESRITNAVICTLFDERPIGLNSMFRVQLGGNAFDGHEFAQEAWKRVVGEGGAGVIGGGDQSLQSLRRAKDMVKRELKLFEIHFAKYYGRPPSRLDKECLRMLYEYHKQLKAYILAEEVKGDRASHDGNPGGAQTGAAAASSSSAAASSSTAGGRVAVPGGGGVSSRDKAGQIQGHGAPAPGHASFPPPFGASSSSSSSSKPSGIKPPSSDTDLKVLKAEKRALKIKLRRFEEEFVRKNGHKPQSYQEVGAIRDDYTRYKYLKEAVAGN